MRTRERVAFLSPMSDDCEHAWVDVWPDSAPDEPAATTPYGRITQQATCLACGAYIERSLRLAGWGEWASTA